MSNQKEKAVREKRTIEATKKNLMGQSGKFGIIAQALGNPIIRQGSSLYSSTELEDPYDDFVETEYETTVSGQSGPAMYRDEILESSDYVEEEGYVFDGLSRGMHLEIQYWFDDQKLTVTYKGYLVYKEAAGELFAYAPFPEWEQLIDKLYKSAKERFKEIKELREVELGEKIKKEKHNFFRRLRERWGL